MDVGFSLEANVALHVHIFQKIILHFHTSQPIVYATCPPPTPATFQRSSLSTNQLGEKCTASSDSEKNCLCMHAHICAWMQFIYAYVHTTAGVVCYVLCRLDTWCRIKRNNMNDLLTFIQKGYCGERSIDSLPLFHECNSYVQLHVWL